MVWTTQLVRKLAFRAVNCSRAVRYLAARRFEGLNVGERVALVADIAYWYFSNEIIDLKPKVFLDSDK